MISNRLRKFRQGAALLIQAVFVGACALNTQPAVFAALASGTAAPRPSETAVLSTPTQPPTPTPSFTSAPTETPPSPSFTPSATDLPVPPPQTQSASHGASLTASLPLSDTALVEALQHGGYVIYFHHTAADPSQADKDYISLHNCATQQNLSEEGRAEALAIGKAFLALAIPVGQVRSSAFCRARDTAMLAFGQAESARTLTGLPNQEFEARVQALREMLSTPTVPGANTVLVAHEDILSAAAGVSIAEGEAAVFAPLGEKGFALVARVLPGEWGRLQPSPAAENQGSPADDSSLLLPDLVVLEPSDLMTLINTDTATKQLKFTTSIQNSGPGPIEIWGHSDPTSLRMIVIQHVKTLDETTRKIVVGEYVFHPQHEHYHFGNFARYEVWSIGANGKLETLLSVNDKVSYCLRDDARSEIPGTDSRQTYLSCNSQRQGISAGWIDIYRNELFGQTVDISQLPDGIYALVNLVDPDHQLRETNPDNNFSGVFFQLEGSRVSKLDSSQIPCGSTDCES